MTSLLPLYRLNDYLATSIQDGLDRQYISQAQDSVAVNSSFLATNRGRVKALTMSTDVAATVELYINDQPQFVSGQPSVNLQTYENPSFYTYNRGDVIKVTRTAGLGVGTVALDLENLELIKRTDIIDTPARERLKRAAERSRYLPQPEIRHGLEEKWKSFGEATSRVQTRYIGTTSGGFVATHPTKPGFVPKKSH